MTFFFLVCPLVRNLFPTCHLAPPPFPNLPPGTSTFFHHKQKKRSTTWHETHLFFSPRNLMLMDFDDRLTQPLHSLPTDDIFSSLHILASPTLATQDLRTPLASTQEYLPTHSKELPSQPEDLYLGLEFGLEFGLEEDQLPTQDHVPHPQPHIAQAIRQLRVDTSDAPTLPPIIDTKRVLDAAAQAHAYVHPPQPQQPEPPQLQQPEPPEPPQLQQPQRQQAPPQQQPQFEPQLQQQQPQVQLQQGQAYPPELQAYPPELQAYLAQPMYQASLPRPSQTETKSRKRKRTPSQQKTWELPLSSPLFVHKGIDSQRRRAILHFCMQYPNQAYTINTILKHLYPQLNKQDMKKTRNHYAASWSLNRVERHLSTPNAHQTLAAQGSGILYRYIHDTKAHFQFVPPRPPMAQQPQYPHSGQQQLPPHPQQLQLPPHPKQLPQYADPQYAEAQLLPQYAEAQPHGMIQAQTTSFR